MQSTRCRMALLSKSSKAFTTKPIPSRRLLSTNSRFLQVSEEVQQALSENRPVVALESTIYTHGFPYPDNVALASRLESLVRLGGGVPATIGILDGIARVGLGADELIRLASSSSTGTTALKVSRRDLGYALGLKDANGRSYNGGTTVSATSVLAHLAGVRVFATGGLGGVHRGVEQTMDVSADLTELGRTPIAVVSAGCKSFLDIPRTVEYLETQGVAVATFADGRTGKIEFPAFYSRESGVPSPMVVQDAAEAANMIHAHYSLGLKSGMLFANPIPREVEIPFERMEIAIKQAITEATSAGASGAKATPYILAKIKELTGDESIVANRALIESNVIMGTNVAKALCQIQAGEAPNSK
jgi:pseudouridine-5'-phosphate glycosidase/pseudouridine kinase